MAKELYIIAGHNGAGKTTFLKEFIKDRNVKHIDVDEIARDISVNKFSLLAIKAGKIALKQIKQFRKKGLGFAVETTFSGKIWKRIINEFKKNSYHITVFFYIS